MRGTVAKLQEGQTCPLRLAGRSRWSWRRVRDGIDLAITEVHALHLFEVEGTGAHPPKDAHLVTAFIRGTVPVETFRKRQVWPMGVIRGDQLWGGTRAKTLIPWGAFRRGKLQHPQAIAPIRHVDKETGVREAHFHTAGIVDLPIRVVDLIEHRRFGTLSINDHQPLLASGDVRIGTGHINIMGFSNWHQRRRDSTGAIREGYVHDFHALIVDNKGITENHGDRTRIAEGRVASVCDNLRLEGIIEVHYNQATRAENIGVRTGNGQVNRPVQLSIWIKSRSTPQEVILGITIRQRIDIDHDEPFSLISHEGI